MYTERGPPRGRARFVRDAPIDAKKAGHVGATDTSAGGAGGMSQVSSDVASHDQRSGGASLASAPGSDGGPNSSALVAHALGIRRCPVDDCAASCFSSSKRRIERMLCQAHVGALSCLVNGVPRRFCQVCYALHGVDAFKGKNKTCTAVLQRKKLLRAQAMESREPRVGGAKNGGSSGRSGDGSVHGVSNDSLIQGTHQAAETNTGGRAPVNGKNRVGARGAAVRSGVAVRSGGKRKASSNGSGRRSAAEKSSGESSGGSGAGGSGAGGSGLSECVVVPTTFAAPPSKKKSTPAASPGTALADAKKRSSKGKSTRSDDSDPSDDSDSPAFDPWGLKTHTPFQWHGMDVVTK